MDTPVVIFDEPTTGQDAAGIARIGEVVSNLRCKTREKQSSPFLMILISAPIISPVSSPFRQEKILKDGTSREVLSQEEILKATYVDPPQITRLGKALGLSSTLISQEDLLAELKKHADAE